MNRYTIIEANVKNDKEDILSVLKRNLVQISLQMYEWKYESCPHGDACCWLAKDEKSDSLVGSAALFPRMMFVQGEPVYVAVAGDFAVDKKHRAYGPALTLQREILQSKLSNTKFKFFYGVPNDLSRMLFFRIGYKEIGKFKRFIKVLKTEGTPKEYLPPSLRYRMLSRMIDFFVRIFAREMRFKRNYDYSVEMPKFFDERFDVFWKKVSKQFDIIGERTSSFLNWRFIQSSYQKFNIFCILDDEKNVAGYVVYFLKDNICHIVDMLFDKSDGVLDSLLMKFLLYARSKEMGSVVIRYLGDESFERNLKRFNFHGWKNDNANVMIFGSDISSESNLLDKNSWHFFRGDNDI